MGSSTLYKGYKIQWAMRKGESNYPASSWKTVPGTTNMLDSNEIQGKLSELTANNPEKIYRPYLMGGK